MFCIILAKGEKSRRLGKIKALIKINGIPLIERIVNELRDCFKKVLIVTTDVEKFKNIKYAKVVEDKYKIGPLGGILTGLKNSPYKYNFVIACDYPFVKKEVVMYMKKIKKPYDVLLFKRNKLIHPLFAIYSKNVIPFIEKNLLQKKYKVVDLIKEVNTKFVENIKNFNFVFFNLNTKKDIKKLHKKFSAKRSLKLTSE